MVQTLTGKARMIPIRLPEAQVIKLREISREEAKNEIRDYLKSRDKAWLDEIADDLRLDFAFVVDIIEELEKDGFVKEV